MILFLSQEMMIIGWVNSKSTESKSKACGLLLNEMIKNFEVDRKERCAFFLFRISSSEREVLSAASLPYA